MKEKSTQALTLCMKPRCLDKAPAINIGSVRYTSGVGSVTSVMRTKNLKEALFVQSVSGAIAAIVERKNARSISSAELKNG